jgi:hypothetical protein
MVITHSNNTQEEWQTKNLYKSQKTKCNHEKGSIPIIFYKLNVEHNCRV